MKVFHLNNLVSFVNNLTSIITPYATETSNDLVKSPSLSFLKVSTLKSFLFYHEFMARDLNYDSNF